MIPSRIAIYSLCCLLLNTHQVQAVAGHLEQHITNMEALVAAKPGDPELRYSLGLAYNDQAQLEDNEAALEKAIAIFEGLQEEYPGMLKAQAMLGSAMVLKARYAIVFRKLHYAKKGFNMLDAAIEANPESADIRLIRAANAANVPAFLGRKKIAREDFAWLLSDIEAHPERYDDGMRRAIYFYAGEFALKSDDDQAVHLLQLAQTTPGQMRLEPRIAAALDEARQQFPESFSKSRQP